MRQREREREIERERERLLAQLASHAFQHAPSCARATTAAFGRAVVACDDERNTGGASTNLAGAQA
jgi:hypothetical protein